MSELTLPQLRAADPAGIRSSSYAWQAMAKDYDDACEEFIRVTRDLPNVWSDSPAADAAGQRTLDLRNTTSNAVPKVYAIARALREFADTIGSLQNLLDSTTTAVINAGYHVDLDTGIVTVPQHLYQQSSTPHLFAQAANSYMVELETLRAQAMDIDAVTTRILDENLPDVQDGFGAAASRSLTAAEVTAAQLDHSPAQITAWWHGLTGEQQVQVLHDFPQLIGWTDGIPAADRDTANRTHLTNRRTALQAEEDALLAQLRGDTPPTGSTVQETVYRLQKIGEEQATIADVDRSLGKLGDRGYLLGVDPIADGRAIISVGNPDTADNVLTYVSGTSSDIPSMEEEVQRAAGITIDAAWKDPEHTTVSIMWLGADAPSSLISAGDEKYAVHAAPALQDFQNGLRATHDGGPAHHTVMGHSYGSTVVGYAARDSLATNEIVFIGSPGVGVDRAADLHFDGGTANVHTSTAANDPIRVTELGKHGDDLYKYGQNPDTPKFGGSHFDSDDGKLWSAHTAYLDEGSSSRARIVDIVIGTGG